MFFMLLALSLHAGKGPEPVVRWEPILAPAVVVSQEHQSAELEALPAIPEVDADMGESQEKVAPKTISTDLAPAKISPSKATHSTTKSKTSTTKMKS